MKRFFDTEMMLRPWFRALKPRLKCLWMFLLGRCDMAGVVDMDWELASFAIGEKVSERDLEAMNGNVVQLSGGKLLLPEFIEFQYGELKEASPIHRGVFKVLAQHGIEYPFDTLLEEKNTLLGVSNTPKDKDKDTVKDKEKEKEKEKPFTKWTDEEFKQSIRDANKDGLLTQDECLNFFQYWLEPDARGRRKYQLGKTWDTRLRMHNSFKLIYSKNRPKPENHI